MPARMLPAFRKNSPSKSPMGRNVKMANATKLLAGLNLITVSGPTTFQGFRKGNRTCGQRTRPTITPTTNMAITNIPVLPVLARYLMTTPLLARAALPKASGRVCRNRVTVHSFSAGVFKPKRYLRKHRKYALPLRQRCSVTSPSRSW